MTWKKLPTRLRYLMLVPMLAVFGSATCTTAQWRDALDDWDSIWGQPDEEEDVDLGDFLSDLVSDW